MTLIGLSGIIGSGKTTAAQILEKEGYTIINFADTLKDVTAALFKWDRRMLEGNNELREQREVVDEYWSSALNRTVTPRSMLQILGTEIFRQNLSPDIWVHCAMAEVKKHKKVVIADVRFPNEIDAIRNAGGKLYVVTRGEPPWIDIAESQKRQGIPIYIEGVHESEYAWISSTFDGIIDNNSTIDQLRLNLLKIIC